MTQPAQPRIEVYPTPNPDAAMFQVEEALVFGGTHEYHDVQAAAASPLALTLFAVPGVEGVLITRHYVTVIRNPDRAWPDLIPPVTEAVEGFLASGQVAVLPTETGAVAGELGDVERRIVDLIEGRLRPALAADGGDVEFMGFEDGIVKVRLVGACHSCPHATATLSFGIQRILMEEIPEVQGVERVG